MCARPGPLQVANRKKFGHGPRVPHFSSFVKTLTLWLAFSLAALFFWFRYLGMLPAAAMAALPATHMGTYHALAIFCSALSAIIFVYEVRHAHARTHARTHADAQYH